MAWTKALSAFSWTTPALPGLVNSRVICRTLGIDLLDCSCAETALQPAKASETPRKVRQSEFMDANLLICERTDRGRAGLRMPDNRAEIRPRNGRFRSYRGSQ